MISNYELQQAYNDLYEVLREYIWEYAVVDAIADLEIAVYETMADIPNIRSQFNKLRQLVRPVSQKEADLRDALDAFDKTIKDDDTVYCKLTKVNEVLQV